MATAYVTIGPVVTRDVLNGESCASETVITSATTASGTIVARAGDVAQIVCDTALYARSGGAASMATGVYCPADAVSYIAMTEGDTISLINA